MKSRLTPYLLSALLVLSVSRFDASGEDTPALDSRDLVELLELQLSDVRQENARLNTDLKQKSEALTVAADREADKPDWVAMTVKLEKANVELKEELAKAKRELEEANALLKGDLTKAKRKLEEENALLKSEVTQLDRDLEASGKLREALTAERNAFGEELVKLEADASGASKDARTAEELKARCRNLEDENAIITQESAKLKAQVKAAETARDQTKQDFERMFKADEKGREKQGKLTGELALLSKKLRSAEAALAKMQDSAIDEGRAKQLASEMEDMKAVESQRKEALDGLFKQLADVKGELKRRDTEIATLRSEIAAGRDELGAKDGKLRASGEQLKEMQAAVESSRKKQAAMDAKLKTAELEILEAQDAAQREVAARKSVEANLESVKSMDAQRKKAMDDVLANLASSEKLNAAREAEIVALRADVSSGREALRAKESELAAGGERAADMRSAADSLQKKLDSMALRLSASEARVTRAEQDASREVAARQGIEAKLDRIKITDEQRKRTMDDVLTNLAAAESLNSERAGKIASLERQVADTKKQGSNAISSLEKRAETLQAEVTRFEQDIANAVDAKGAVDAKLREHEAAAQRDATRLVSLEADLARVSATDGQRKKAMDKLLLEMSALEASGGDQRRELSEAREEIALLKTQPAAAVDDDTKAELARLKKINADLEANVATLKAQARDTVSPDAAIELGKLEDENAALLKRVAALESQVKDAVAPVPANNDKEAAVLLNKERAQWQKAQAEREQDIAKLKKAGEAQDAMVARLKADLAESEQAKAQLAGEAKQLRNRKVDVRSTDIYKEIEQINVTFREKLMQVESERQRLAKSLKKLEKRDASYDDEIAHENEIRRKAETELADARSREVEYQELIERLTAKVPQLEKQVSGLEDGSETLKSALVESEENLRALKMELEKREHRLSKALRVAEVLESAREDVLHASDKEKLDMHYNMAAVYAREGKFEEAEQKYLHALRLNPLDADVHYNLGILYDDELNSPVKAVVHYRRYLKLNPHGAEADQVRDWLMKIEMKMKQ
jgi:chromosome segregation ATPase